MTQRVAMTPTLTLTLTPTLILNLTLTLTLTQTQTLTLTRCESKAAFTEWTTLIKNIEDPKLTFHRKSVVGDLAR